MQRDTANKDVRTLGYVLRRTNYGEADRILNLITPIGKMAVIARGVRKEKSKLAGGIEMFSLSDFNIHLGKGEFGVVTGVKMIEYYDKIVKDFRRMEIAGMILKKISAVAESSDNPEYFKLVDQSLKALNEEANNDLVEGWFLINLLRTMGEEMNLYRDRNGEKLKSEKRYDWDGSEGVFFENENGEYGEDEIKMLRLMSKLDLGMVRKIKVGGEMILKNLRLIKVVARV